MKDQSNSQAAPAISSEVLSAHASITHNINEFLTINKVPNSGNPLNNHKIFEKSKVIAEGWMLPTKDIKVNPRRKGYDDNQIHFTKFRLLFSCVTFDSGNPICVDRKGRILDGVYRMWIFADINETARFGAKKVFVRQYDFE